MSRVLARAAVLVSALFALAGCSALPDAWVPDRTPVWERPPPPAADRPVVDPSRLTRETLPNGLQVIVLEDRRLPRVGLGVAVPRGAGAEPVEQAGLAGYTAELMERGAGARTALELAGVVDALGASLGAGADWDSTTVGVSGLSGDFDVLFDVLTDVVLEPRFDADEGERVRAERVAGIERAADDPSTLARWHLYRALYDGHRYGLPAEGATGSVSRLDAAAARAWHEAVFTPQGAIFWAVGDVESEEVLARVRESFGEWEGEGAPSPGAPPPPEVPPARRVVIVDRPDLGQAQIAVGHEGIARADDRRITVQLLNTVLGAGGFSSRLMSTVRAEEGLTYGIGSGFGERRHPGPFAVITFTRVPETRRVVDLVLGELERMQREPPDAEELGKAKGLRTGSFGLALETSAAVAATLVDLEIYDLPDDSIDTYRRRVRAVTPEQVAEAARELLHPGRTAIVAVGPADTLTPLLEPLGPVEIVQP